MRTASVWFTWWSSTRSTWPRRPGAGWVISGRRAPGSASRRGAGCGGWLALAGDGVQEPEELLDVQRLGQERPHALAEQVLDQARPGIGAEDHHRDLGGLGVGLQATEDLPAGHVGQVQVQ